MKFINSLVFRLTGFFSRNATLVQKEAIVAGTFTFVTKNEKPANKLKLWQLLYNNRLKSYPLISNDERLRFYGWITLFNAIKNIDGAIVEAGVGYGNTLITLASANAYFKAGKQLYAFDSFEGFPSPHKNDIGVRVTNLSKVEGWEDNSPELINSVIQGLNATSTLKINIEDIIYCQGFFNTTMPLLLPEKIALLHIDNDLYEGAKHVLETTYPKLQANAIVIFDEYHDPKWPGVKMAADEFAALHKIELRYFSEVQRYGFIK
jgi:hypothetical protein